ncbi:dihydropteroate synthase [Murinocardiopsis flavida]|uniref:Dihydropteroate synthase n=1 Tax=Murinocardiopsis flavida TaxID=645275 RepID=A0A2P8DSK0_9ACTN|nr:dihydropteroate synthase [Murinocardiopsis flavida]PSL00181.1 dihydropteroate synthase [Murinocardiopsis flavida]
MSRAGQEQDRGEGSAARVPSGRLRLGGRVFGPGDHAVMAVVNRTPDSFYDKGATFGFASAMRAVDTAVERGADIIDVGGVKAGYGAHVSAAEEIRRTVPFVAALRERHPGVVISVDTWRARVGGECAEAGADMINDTWAGADPGLAAVAAEHGLALVCSHSGGLAPRTDPHRVAYEDVMADVVGTVTGLAERAVGLGVDPDRVMIDPTHDFGKNTYHSLELTRRLGELAGSGWPVLVAVSNKDFIGETLDAAVTDRLAGTLAVLAVSAWEGARVFRVHDVAAARSALDAVAALAGS